MPAVSPKTRHYVGQRPLVDVTGTAAAGHASEPYPNSAAQYCYRDEAGVERVFVTDDGHCRYSDVYRVTTNDSTDTAAVVLVGIATAPPNGPGIIIGTPYAQDSGAWCQAVVPRQESFSPFVWIVTCSFSSKRERNADPTANPVEFEWDSEESKEVVAFDRDNQAILNSAGDHFPDPLTRDRAHKVVTITANMAAIPSWFLTLDDPPRVNNSQINIDGVIIGPNKAKVRRVKVGKSSKRNTIAYRPLTLIVAVRNRSWTETVLDLAIQSRMGRRHAIGLPRAESTDWPDHPKQDQSRVGRTLPTHC